MSISPKELGNWVDDLFGEPKKPESRMVMFSGLVWRFGKNGAEVAETGQGPFRKPTEEEMEKYRKRLARFGNYGTGDTT